MRESDDVNAQAKLNGFSTRASMQKAHERLCKDLGALLPESPRTILDAGCGDGALLERLGHLYVGTHLWGLEHSTARWRAACRRFEVWPGPWQICRTTLCETAKWPAGVDLVMINPRRFVDGADTQRTALVNACRACRWVCFYDYGWSGALVLGYLHEIGIESRPMAVDRLGDVCCVVSPGTAIGDIAAGRTCCESVWTRM